MQSVLPSPGDPGFNGAALFRARSGIQRALRVHPARCFNGAALFRARSEIRTKNRSEAFRAGFNGAALFRARSD